MPATSASDPAFHAVLLALVAIAAFTDVRKGVIPDWLTLSTLLLSPIVHGVIGGGSALLGSLIGMLVCAVIPLIVFYVGGMAGGDVKLFAAIGALGGAYLGLEAQLLSLVVASIYALGLFAWEGKFFAMLGNSLLVGLNPILPRRFRRSVPRELMHRIRLGAPILLGSLIALAGHHPELLS